MTDRNAEANPGGTDAMTNDTASMWKLRLYAGLCASSIGLFLFGLFTSLYWAVGIELPVSQLACAATLVAGYCLMVVALEIGDRHDR